MYFKSVIRNVNKNLIKVDYMVLIDLYFFWVVCSDKIFVLDKYFRMEGLLQYVMIMYGFKLYVNL